VKHLDLFSGIGGFALAARNVGWETIGFCEIEPYAQKVLAKHWPGVPIYEDIRGVVANTAGTRQQKRRPEKSGPARNKTRGPRPGGLCVSGRTANGPQTAGPVDIITGGFPCQDISYAGKGAGIDGERSGLWKECARLIGEIRPRYAVLENVAALLSRGLDRVAGDLATIGYDCEWHCIPASAIGAPHRRDRIWIVGYPNDQSEPVGTINAETHELPEPVADTVSERGRGRDAERQHAGDAGQPSIGPRIDTGGVGAWDVEPDVGRVANGVPSRVDRLRGLGNAIVPQVAEVIFQAINQVDQ